MKIDVGGDEACELGVFPAIVRPPVNQRCRAIRTDEVEAFGPDFVAHEDEKDHVGLVRGDRLHEGLVELCKVREGGAVPAIEQSNITAFPSQIPQIGQDVGVFVAFTARCITIRVATKHSEDLHDTACRSRARIART